MQNTESLQMIKEQLKIKSVELRKATEEKGKVAKKFKDLVATNRDETAKLKKELKKVKEDAEIERRKAITATRLAKQSGIEAGKIEAEKIEAAKNKEEEIKMAKKLEEKLSQKMVDQLDNLKKRSEILLARIEKEKQSNKKFQRERGVLIKELKRLREDKDTVANMKKKVKILKSELEKAKKTSASSGETTEDIVKEKDALIKKYEDMLNKDMDTGEDGIIPSEAMMELKDEVADLEKERRKMVVEMSLLKKDNEDMDMKIILLEDELNKSGGGDSSNTDESRAAQASEFSSGLENFLITYSDMITLLLVIFVLMFTASKLDANKFAEVMSSFQTKKMRTDYVNVRLNSDEMKMLKRVRELVKDNVDAESLVRSDTKTILHRLPTADLFAPGEAFFSDGAEKLIVDTIRNDMKEGVKQVFIDGHTDNVPMKSAKFPSNWELSSARASKVARFIIKTMRFPAKRMVVTGYGEFRPLRPNTSDDNRAANRRVEIKILKDVKVAEKEAKDAEKNKTKNPSKKE
tara:strand:+ start:962 stop:2521 length:1560 start_codon:yes stop_codon:yes gene_type:complete